MHGVKKCFESNTGWLAPKKDLQLTCPDNHSTLAIFQVWLCRLHCTVQATIPEAEGGTRVAQASFEKMHSRSCFFQKNLFNLYPESFTGTSTMAKTRNVLRLVRQYFYCCSNALGNHRSMKLNFPGGPSSATLVPYLLKQA